MDENNKQNKVEIKKENKANKQGILKQYKTEFKKITWPTKKVLVKQTITVIIVSIIVGLIIFGYDVVIKFLLDKLIQFMS